ILKGVLIEARFILLTSVLAGFGRIIGEVGVSMILGGNIKGFTRTITTAIALESSRGEFVIALALGIILMSIAVILNLAVILIFGSPNRGEI
ncbi:ABC transporter permease, partial [bacterium]|nr:ABC transporter permease [bacterium]